MNVDEVCRNFENLLPIHEHSANWCICQVKVVLTRLDIQIHDKVIKIVIFSCFLHDSLNSILI
jgi:hypothetical protein